MSSVERQYISDMLSSVRSNWGQRGSRLHLNGEWCIKALTGLIEASRPC